MGILAVADNKNGSYHIKDDCENVIQQNGNIDLIVFKAKRGTGTKCSIPLKVNKKYMVVEDRVNNNNFSAPVSVKKSKYA